MPHMTLAPGRSAPSGGAAPNGPAKRAMKRKGKVPKRESLARQFLLELLEDPDSTSARPSCVSDAELARSIDDCFADPLMVTKIVHRLAKIRGGAANTPACLRCCGDSSAAVC